MRNMLALAVLGLMLTGCAATPAATPAAGPSATAPAEATPAPTITAAPLPEQPESTTPESVEVDEAGFLNGTTLVWKGTQPDDGDLLAAGYFACSELRSGKPEAEVVAVQGDSEDAIYNNGAVLAYAGLLCPEFLKL